MAQIQRNDHQKSMSISSRDRQADSYDAQHSLAERFEFAVANSGYFLAYPQIPQILLCL